MSSNLFVVGYEAYYTGCCKNSVSLKEQLNLSLIHVSWSYVVKFVWRSMVADEDECILCTSILCSPSWTMLPASLSNFGCGAIGDYGLSYICPLLVAFFVLQAVHCAGALVLSILFNNKNTSQIVHALFHLTLSVFCPFSFRYVYECIVVYQWLL